MREDTKLMTVEDLAALLNVRRSWIYKNIGAIPHYKIGILLRFDMGKIEEWLERGGKAGGSNRPHKPLNTSGATSSDLISFPSRAIN
jgi:excisionase family DNA binding protein